MVAERLHSAWGSCLKVIYEMFFGRLTYRVIERNTHTDHSGKDVHRSSVWKHTRKKVSKHTREELNIGFYKVDLNVYNLIRYFHIRTLTTTSRIVGVCFFFISHNLVFFELLRCLSF